MAGYLPSLVRSQLLPCMGCGWVMRAILMSDGNLKQACQRIRPSRAVLHVVYEWPVASLQHRHHGKVLTGLSSGT
jgi:hypothetical protein